MLENLVVPRPELLGQQRKAYRVRSSIVHGGDLDPADVRGLAGGRVSVGEFATDLEQVVRGALRKAIRLQASGEGFPPEWDELLFP